MTGQRVGYTRVSSDDQNTSRQLDGIQLDAVFEDRASAKDTNRPQLQAMIKHVRKEDTFVVHSMDRLARNLGDLLKIVEDLTDRGVKVEFIKESLTFSGEDSPMATFMLGVTGAFAEMERALIKERQREDIAIARRKGVYKGRKKSLSEEKVTDLRERAANRIQSLTGPRV